MTNRSTRTAGALLLVLAFFGAGCAAQRAFHDAEKEEIREHWDLAVLAYDKAHRLDPENARFKKLPSTSRPSSPSP